MQMLTNGHIDYSQMSGPTVEPYIPVLWKSGTNYRHILFEKWSLGLCSQKGSVYRQLAGWDIGRRARGIKSGTGH
jgi:hypothetical protein